MKFLRLCLWVFLSGSGALSAAQIVTDGEVESSKGLLDIYVTSEKVSEMDVYHMIYNIKSFAGGTAPPEEPYVVDDGSAMLPNSAVSPTATPVNGNSPGGAGGASYRVFLPQSLFLSDSLEAAHPRLTTAQPVTPPDQQLIFLDGTGNSILAVDQKTLTVVSNVVVPSTTGPFGIRPGTGNTEVWVANGGSGVPVVDLASQSVVTTIPTPLVPQGTLPVIGLVFDPTGATAYEGFQYYSPDSAGNNGAVVVFDAVNRQVTATVPQKNAPAALVMAPDGSTLYILDTRGNLTYYDVLSGTADLSVSTFAPGSDAGYPGIGSNVFIHPDGTRLFWNVGVYLVVFDLKTRTATNQFNSGLPTTAGRTFTLSQDGTQAFFSDGKGDLAIMDTQAGTILLTYNIGAGAVVFDGPSFAP